MTQRTKDQKAANEIDIELYHLAQRIEIFAQMKKGGQDAGAIDNLSSRMYADRYLIRRYMHPDDVDATR